MLVNLSCIRDGSFYVSALYPAITGKSEQGEKVSEKTNLEQTDGGDYDDSVRKIYARANINLSRLENLTKKLSEGYTRYEHNNTGVEFFKLDNDVKTQVVVDEESDLNKLTETYPRLKKLLKKLNTDTEQTTPVTEETSAVTEETSQAVVTERTNQNDTQSIEIPKRDIKNILNRFSNNISNGNENTNTVSIESLGSSSGVSTVVQLSEEEKNTIANINGLIDEYVYQGATGDCWLIGAVASLLNSEKGRQFIKDSIKVNDDYSVTVTFGGVGISYTLTPAEITKHDTDKVFSDSYSNGDNDMLVLELATEKLLKDLRLGNISLRTDDINITYTGEGHGIDDGGLPSQTIYYMTGVESDEYYKDDMSNLDTSLIKSLLKKTYENGNSALSFVIYGKDHSATLVDGSGYYISVGTYGHVLSVTDIDENTVTFINPWNLGNEYTMTYDEFAKLGIGYICYSDLNKADVFDEITDAATFNQPKQNTTASGIDILALHRKS